MALPISSIPVLTGEVAQRFETEAQANYKRYLHRTEDERLAEEIALKKEFESLRKMLSKAHIG